MSWMLGGVKRTGAELRRSSAGVWLAALMALMLGACSADTTSPELSESVMEFQSQAVTSFTLIDADADQPIAGFDPLPEGAVLNLATLPTRNLNIRANTSPQTVGSVRFRLDGSNVRTENAAPYALAGDASGNYYPWTPSLGAHTLTATPYSNWGAGGTAGSELTRQFTVVDSQPPTVSLTSPSSGASFTAPATITLAASASDSDGSVAEVAFYQGGVLLGTDSTSPYTFTWSNVAAGSYTLTARATDNSGVSATSAPVSISVSEGGQAVVSFTLINADTDQPIPGFDPMMEGSTLDFSTLPTQNLNIRANTSPQTVGSVRFVLDGNNFRTESAAPYALAGDASGNYYPWTPGPGSHTLTATPYTGASASGTAGTPLMLTFHVGSGGGDCGCDIVVEADTAILDGSTTPHAPGDTICLMAGLRQPLRLQNFQGSATHPLIIKNCGGRVELSSSTRPYGIDVWNSKHFRITGTGDAGHTYGIKVSQSTSVGIALGKFSTDFEVDHVEIENVEFAGIISKTDPTCSNPDLRHFVQRNSFFHHNYIHDTIGGEGFYIGYHAYPQRTDPDCPEVTLYPHALENVQIHDNLVRNTGWDGIQLGSAAYGGAIFRNVVENAGAARRTFQQSGIQLNAGTSGDVFNNIIRGGTGTAIVVFGTGGNKIYNNLVIGPEADGIFCDDRWTLPGAGFSFLNNTIVQPGRDGMRMYSDESTGNTFYNNLIAAPGGSCVYLLSSSIDWSESHNLCVSAVAGAGFVDPAGGNYRLRGDSPACDTGRDTSPCGVTDDLDGLSRYVPYDIGAYESCR